MKLLNSLNGRLNMKAYGSIRSVIIGLSITFLSACGGGSSEDQTKIEFQEIENVEYSGIQNARNVIINDMTSWTAFWAEHKSVLTDPPAAPQVDFSNKTVVAVFVGTRPNGCYRVKINDVQVEGEKNIVRYTEKAPEAGVLCTLSLTQPSHIISIPKSTRPFEFRKTN